MEMLVELSVIFVLWKRQEMLCLEAKKDQPYLPLPGFHQV